MRVVGLISDTRAHVMEAVFAFGPRWCSAEATARVLFGEAAPEGTSPVSEPGTDILAG